MPPWASHHVMLEVAGHTGQTTFPNTRLHKDRPASPTFIFSSGFKKAIPKKSICLIQISENQKPDITLTLTARTNLLVRLLWFHWGPGMHMLHWSGASGHTIHHQISGMRTSGQQVQGIIPLLQFIELNFGPFWWEFRSPKASQAFGMGSFEVVLIQQDSLPWSFWAQEQHWNQALGWPTNCPA